MNDLQRIELDADWAVTRRFFDWRWWLRCRVKILVVTDTGGSFDTLSGFGLGRALDEIRADQWPHVVFEFTTAHRRNTSADITNFTFDAHDLSQYHQIWLFGVERSGTPLPQSEMRALAEFMDGGGGVFATGDHEDLGVDLCGQVPRVGSMRRWYHPIPGPNGEPVAPDQTGAGRLDTVVDPPGPSTGSQTDTIPQVIRPRWYTSPHPLVIFGHAKYPHPVLCGPEGVITHLPDHMHEGVIEVPADLTRQVTFDGYTTDEYPVANGVRPAPEVIAWATNHVTGEEFGVLGAYDGHRAGVGRVFVDATWHHWFNINMDPYRDGSDPGHATYDPSVVDKWEEIKAYLRNVASWLSPAGLQSCLRNNGWLFVIGNYEVLMSVKDLRKVTSRVEYFWQLGTFARDALGRLASRCQTVEWTWPWFAEQHMFIPPWVPVEEGTRIPSLPMLDPDDLAAVALGGAVHALATELAGADPDSLAELINAEDRLLEIGRPGSDAALDALAAAYRHGAAWFGGTSASAD
ncbi:MAG TPA: hypothetical protein VMM13_10655 [Euzebya sp.]|nr:hypothetical protein [Euzebya sp.]